MILKQLELGPMANYIYILGDPSSKKCAVVDPSWDVPAIFQAIEEEGLRLSAILITHNHFDHIGGLSQVLAKSDAPVYVHEKDAFALDAYRENLKTVRGGEKIRLGDLEISFVHTPGHTEGSQCFLFQNRLVTGDTLFIGGCGRVDLPGSDPEKMYHSLRKIAQLPDETTVFPGHNYSPEKSAALAQEKESNKFLAASKQLSIGEFLELLS